MKKGKTTKINGFRTSKIIYGTVDSKEFKSLDRTQGKQIDDNNVQF